MDHNALPSRFKRSRSPSREMPTQNGHPAQNARVVIELSDSEEDGMNVNLSEMSMGGGTAHAPPQGAARLSVEMNMDMEKMSMEAGKAHAPPQGPARRKEKTHSGCAYCHSDFHADTHCPHRGANLGKKGRKAVQMANRRASKAVQRASRAVHGANKALQTATSLGVKNSQTPTGPKADTHLHHKKPTRRGKAEKRKAPRQKRAANPAIAHTAPAYPPSSYQAQVYPGPQSGAAGQCLSRLQPAVNPPIAHTVPTNPSSSYQDPAHPDRQQLMRGAATTQLDKFSRPTTERDMIVRHELIPGLNVINATATTYPPSSYQDQVHTDHQPSVAAQPDEFTRLKTERDKIAQLQELVPSISFVNARNALLMHRWDLSLAFEMAGIIEDKKAGAGKAGHGAKRAVQEWEARHLDDQGPREVRKPPFSGASALPETAYEPLERHAMGMSKAEYLSQAGDMKPVVGNDKRTSLLSTHQYSGGQGEDMRCMATTGHHARGNEVASNTFKMAEGGYGQEMLADASSLYPADTGFSGGTGPSYLAEHSFDQVADTAGGEGINSILRRLMHK